MKECPHLRTELEPLPDRLKKLPVDRRGYPVPWFVQWIDGEPEFRAMDSRKWIQAVKERRCWVCGQLLGKYVSFVSGPMCGINRTSSEPPSHRECAEWSARNCPFLNMRMPKRREGGLPDENKGTVGGLPILHNPGVALVWTTKAYRPFQVPNGVLIEMGEPESIGFFAQGRVATRQEIDDAVEKGFPKLQELADAEGPEAIEALGRMRQRFFALVEKFSPKT